MPTYFTWLRFLTKALPTISFPSEPAVKWMPISQPSNQLSRNRFWLVL